MTTHDTEADKYNLQWEHKGDNIWPAFVAILGLFHFLYLDKATDKISIWSLTAKALKKTSTTWDGAYILPKTGHAYLFPRQIPGATDIAEYNRILSGLDKHDTIETVLRVIEPHVQNDKKPAFQEVALKVFDTNLRITQRKNPLWKNAYTLYTAGHRQIVFTGAPGTGKTYTAKTLAEDILHSEGVKNIEEHREFVQFHSAYDYSNFVEGLQPVTLPGQTSPTFVRMDGIFKKFCRKALADPNKPYFFIIDEINRADLFRVFGELMYCLDEDYRITDASELKDHGVITQYANLNTYILNEDGFATELPSAVYRNRFAIPENVTIFATMNDIDRSVEAFDFALRRRFKWLAAYADDEMEEGLKGILKEHYDSTLLDRTKRLNAAIVTAGKALGLDASYQIGHAYYSAYKGKDSLQNIWDFQIKLILNEYVRGKHNKDGFIKACEDAFFLRESAK